MPYKLRKSNRAISKERAEALIAGCLYGILSLMGEEDGELKPYGVPITPVMLNQKLYFHCAMEGRKIDCIRKYPKASFCAVGDSEFGDAGEYLTAYFESAIASGTIREVTDRAEKLEALVAISDKFLKDIQRSKAIAQSGLEVTNVLCMEIEHIQGKERTRNGS